MSDNLLLIVLLVYSRRIVDAIGKRVFLSGDCSKILVLIILFLQIC
jgi:hypothetical protein